MDGNFCKFGDNVWIAPNVSILTAGHPLDVQDRIDGWEYAFPVTVGNNVWIGESVTIIGGVTIGDNAVIAAMCPPTPSSPAIRRESSAGAPPPIAKNTRGRRRTRNFIKIN